jgi:hypothetical protein
MNAGPNRRSMLLGALTAGAAASHSRQSVGTPVDDFR